MAVAKVCHRIVISVGIMKEKCRSDEVNVKTEAPGSGSLAPGVLCEGAEGGLGDQRAGFVRRRGRDLGDLVQRRRRLLRRLGIGVRSRNLHHVISASGAGRRGWLRERGGAGKVRGSHAGNKTKRKQQAQHSGDCTQRGERKEEAD